MLKKAMFLAMFAICVACGDGQFEMKPTVAANPTGDLGADAYEQQPAVDNSNPYATNVANSVQPYSPATSSSSVGGSTNTASSSVGDGKILNGILGIFGNKGSTSNTNVGSSTYYPSSNVGSSTYPSSYSPGYSYSPTYSSPSYNTAPVVPVKSSYSDLTKPSSSSSYSPTYSTPSSSYSSPSSSSSVPVTAATYKGVNDYTPSYGYGTVPSSSYGNTYGGYSNCGC